MEKKKLRKVQSGLFRIIFSRTGLVLVMILLQIGLFVVSMSRLQQYSQVINGFFRILGIIVLIYIINSEDNPAFKMTWMLCGVATSVPFTMIAAPTFILEISAKLSSLSLYTTCNC